MKRFSQIALLGAALLLAACSAHDAEAPQPQGEIVYPELRIGVAQMDFRADSRAREPMNPDAEKSVITLAIFEFDNEGLHTNSPSTYHFIDFPRGTVDGVSGVGNIIPAEHGVMESSLKGLSFREYSNGTICLVGNVTEEQVAEFYANGEPGQSSGRVTLEQFKKWTLPFEYESVNTNTKEYDDSTAGHLKVMYMFGYYQGPINPSTPEAISIDLGRLASRLDITVVNETGKPIEKRLGYHFHKVCTSAYVFPVTVSVTSSDGTSRVRTVICSGPQGAYNAEGETTDPVYGKVPETFPDKGVHTHYFYAAAHSAKNKDEATSMHILYNSAIVSDDSLPSDAQDTSIPLCNVVPSQADQVNNGYSLSRNTRYHFTIRLKGAPSTPSTASVSTASTGRDAASAGCETSVRYEYTNPGEITVYLPLDD